MRDYIKRFIIAGIMALCVSLLFLGGRHTEASMQQLENLTEHWIWPSEGVITDIYGTRHGSHKGIDIAAEPGAPVYAVDHGIVTKSYYSDTYGHVIFIKHQNNTETIYAHLNERIAKEGKEVLQGEKIGKMGNTGDSSGVHLHFELHMKEWTYDKENSVDPFIAFGKEEIGQVVQVVHNDRDTKTVAASASQLEYVVKKGDTLFAIAKNTNTTVEQLFKLNNLETDIIQPHQILIIQSN